MAVTTTRVVVGGTTYALRNITSVSMTYTPPQLGCAILVLLGGLFLLLLIIIPFNENNYHPIAGCILGGSIMLGSIVWMSRIKTKYHVNLSSTAGEVHALTSKNKAYIEKIVVSINDAIVKYK